MATVVILDRSVDWVSIAVLCNVFKIWTNTIANGLFPLRNVMRLKLGFLISR